MRSNTSTENLLGIFITIAATFVLCGRNYFITKDYKTRINDITVSAGSLMGIMSTTSAFAKLIFILLMAIGVTFTMMLYQKQISYLFSIYDNYGILDANTGVPYELIAFTIITSLSWLLILLRRKTLILLKDTRRFWTCRLYPRDN
uniref:Uncharacterized protein n=1 Tax=Glossina austeni TaxID=7395 RepID=A0A1A9UCY4_GLOAU